MILLLARLSVHHTRARYLLKSEEHIRPPEVEVINGVSQHVGARNQTHILCKSHKCSQLLNHLSRPSVVEINLYKTNLWTLKGSLRAVILQIWSKDRGEM